LGILLGHVLLGTTKKRISNLKCDPSEAVAEFFEPRAKELPFGMPKELAEDLDEDEDEDWQR